jgi:excisionase family DNA binding protein
MSMSQFLKSSPASKPILVDCREAARLLSISPRTLWQLTNDGEIPSLKIGAKCVRYRVVDLETWTRKQVEQRNQQLNEVDNGQH